MNELEKRIKAKLPGEDTGITVRRSLCDICAPGTHCGLSVYVKDGRVIGLSKLARIVDSFAKRPQLQERLTAQVADFLYKELEPLGVAVVIEAQHLCMTMRGARAAGSETRTSALRGVMRTDAKTRAEVLALLKE